MTHLVHSRPRVALVLGCGGVRSAVALGVHDVLSRAGIAVDVVVGSSAGALFGGLIAAGLTTERATALAIDLWTPEITRQIRWGAVAQMIWPRLGRFGPDFGMRHDGRILARLREAFGDSRLEAFATPLRIVATEARSGQAVVLSQGSAVDAMRASVALPFMFKPFTIDGRRLVDGHLSAPLPVLAAADADMVIAAGNYAPMPRKIDRPSRMLSGMTTAMINNLMRAQLAAASAGGARLVHVEPALERHVGLFDTRALPHLIDCGRRATEALLPEIRALVSSRGLAARRSVA